MTAFELNFKIVYTNRSIIPTRDYVIDLGQQISSKINEIYVNLNLSIDRVVYSRLELLFGFYLRTTTAKSNSFRKCQTRMMQPIIGL